MNVEAALRIESSNAEDLHQQLEREKARRLDEEDKIRREREEMKAEKARYEEKFAEMESAMTAARWGAEAVQARPWLEMQKHHPVFKV